MTDQLFLYILIVHFLADFGLQTHQQATMKGKSNLWLFYHVGVYSVIWLICSFIFLGNFWSALWFALVTFICHFTTDWITSRIGKPFWEKKDLHNGFVVVGFDQVLHYIQLYYTFKYIINL
jgi:hypothetical protein